MTENMLGYKVAFYPRSPSGYVGANAVHIADVALDKETPAHLVAGAAVYFGLKSLRAAGALGDSPELKAFVSRDGKPYGSVDISLASVRSAGNVQLATKY